MLLVTKKLTFTQLSEMAKAGFGNLVKAVVDIEKSMMVVDAELHADEEAYLLGVGSKQENLWGINLYPEFKGDNFIEFDSMINLKPSIGNNSRGIDNPEIRKKIIAIVKRLIKL